MNQWEFMDKEYVHEVINFKNNKCDCRTNQPLPPVSRIAVNVRTISSI